ncbi:hypothetical protein, partial [Frankia sp. AgW1.1]
MIVHFIAAKNKIERDYAGYRAIIDTITDLGHQLARDWVDPEHELMVARKGYGTIDWTDVYRQNMAALSRSEVVIAEASRGSSATGYMVSKAIDQKTPVLILTKNNQLEVGFT